MAVSAVSHPAFVSQGKKTAFIQQDGGTKRCASIELKKGDLPFAFRHDDQGSGSGELPRQGTGLSWQNSIHPRRRLRQGESPRPTILQKAGGADGIFSFVAFAPGYDVGIFVAINTFDFAASFGMTEMALDLLADFADH